MINLNLKTKNEYRKLARKIRKSLDIETVSEQIVEKLTNTDIYLSAKKILAYYPFSNEVDIRPCFEDNTKNWFLPRVNGDIETFKVCRYSLGDNLEKNRWKIPEPTAEAVVIEPKKLDMVIIPALMLDEKGFRLGYGGGFYDRFLPLLKKSCVKVVAIPDELLIKTLPLENHDMPVDFLVTQTTFLKFND